MKKLSVVVFNVVFHSRDDHPKTCPTVWAKTAFGVWPRRMT